MQVTVDIPEPLYRALAARAHEAHTSIEAMILASTDQSLRQTYAQPGGEGQLTRALRTGANLNDVALMTDDEFAEFARP